MSAGLGPMTPADDRASSLYLSIGFSPERPPNLLRFARALLGDEAIHFAGRAGERGALVTSISADRIYLHRWASRQQNAFAIARGLARWDVAHGGPVRNVARLALSLALPFEAMTGFLAAGLTTKQIASSYHLPVAVVRRRRALLRFPRHVLEVSEVQ